jgi:hypothetical protein
MRDGGVDKNPAGQAWIRANKAAALRFAHRDPVCLVHALATDPSFLRGTACCLASGSGYSKEAYVRSGFRFDNDCVEGIVRECVYPSLASPDSYRDGDEMMVGLSRVSESTLWPETLSREGDLASAAILATELSAHLPEVDEEDLATLLSEPSEPEKTKIAPVLTSRLWSDIVDDLDDD